MSEHLKDAIVEALTKLERTLSRGSEPEGAADIRSILMEEYGSGQFWEKVTSTRIWGGSGSLFDQAFVDPGGADRALRDEFYQNLLQLGESLEAAGRANRFVQSADLVLKKIVRGSQRRSSAGESSRRPGT